MELTYDWRSFQEVFYPHRRVSPMHSEGATGPVYVISEDGSVVTAFTEHEDLSDWIGGSAKEMQEHFGHREVITFDRSEVDQWVQSSTSRTHFYDQVEFLRSSASSRFSGENGFRKERIRGYFKAVVIRLKNLFSQRAVMAPELRRQLPVRRHFLLEAMKSWWSRVLPSSYGIFIRLEPHSQAVGTPPAGTQDLLVIVRRGQIDGFIEPDLNSIGPERKRQPADVVKYLSEKYLVPVQGVFVHSNEWAGWSQDPVPWADILKSMRTGRTKIVPFRWGIAGLMTLKGVLGI